MAESLKDIALQLLFVEVTAPNRYEDSMKRVGHLTPNLLKQELTSFRRLNSYLPRVVAVHMNPGLEREIAGEMAQIGAETDASITLAYEGMQLEL